MTTRIALLVSASVALATSPLSSPAFVLDSAFEAPPAEDGGTEPGYTARLTTSDLGPAGSLDSFLPPPPVPAPLRERLGQALADHAPFDRDWISLETLAAEPVAGGDAASLRPVSDSVPLGHVPEPAAVSVLLVGLFAGLRRRR